MDRIISKSFYMLTGMNSRALYDRYKMEKLRPSPYRLLLRLNEKPAHFLNDRENRRLKCFFEPMVMEFADVTGLDLNRWGYPAGAPATERRRSEGARG